MYGMYTYGSLNLTGYFYNLCKSPSAGGAVTTIRALERPLFSPLCIITPWYAWQLSWFISIRCAFTTQCNAASMKCVFFRYKWLKKQYVSLTRLYSICYHVNYLIHLHCSLISLGLCERVKYQCSKSIWKSTGSVAWLCLWLFQCHFYCLGHSPTPHNSLRVCQLLILMNKLTTVTAQWSSVCNTTVTVLFLLGMVTLY